MFIPISKKKLTLNKLKLSDLSVSREIFIASPGTLNINHENEIKIDNFLLPIKTSITKSEMTTNGLIVDVKDFENSLHFRYAKDDVGGLINNSGYIVETDFESAFEKLANNISAYLEIGGSGYLRDYLIENHSILFEKYPEIFV